MTPPPGEGRDETNNVSVLAPLAKSSFAMDMYAQLFDKWADPTPADLVAMQPYFPNYADHLAKAKLNAQQWILGVRGELNQFLASIQGFGSDFLADAEAMRELIIKLNDPAQARDRDALLEELRGILGGIISTAKQLRTRGLALQTTMVSFAGSVGRDIEKLSSDYEKLVELQGQAAEDMASFGDAQDRLSQAHSDVIGFAVGVALGGLVAVISIVALVVTAGTAAPVAVPALTLSIGSLVGTVPGLVGAVNRESKARDEVEELEAKLNKENSAIHAVSSLSKHFYSLSTYAETLDGAMDQLIGNFEAIPEELTNIVDDAIEARYEDDVTRLDDRLAKLAQDFSDLRDAAAAVADLFAATTVQSAEGQQRSSVEYKQAS